MLEELVIYKKYIEFMYYTNEILKKYPKSERYLLVDDIKSNLNRGIVLIIECHKERNRNIRITKLNEIDTVLKILKVFIRMSYRYKYVNVRNYNSFSRKITDICNLLGGWINSCLKQ